LFTISYDVILLFVKKRTAFTNKTYGRFQKADPKTPHIKKEAIMADVPPTEVTKHNNGDLLYMKVNLLSPLDFVCVCHLLIYNIILQALYHALPMDYVTIAKLQGKLDGEASQNIVRKLIDKMVRDGYVKNSANRRLGN